MVLSLALQRTGGLCARRAHSLLRPSGAKRSAGGFTKIPDQNKAYLFNEGPGPRKMQAWEYIIYPTYIIAAAILFIGLPNVPNTGIKVGTMAGGGGGLALQQAAQFQLLGHPANSAIPSRIGRAKKRRCETNSRHKE
jgi:hypothetical protein